MSLATDDAWGGSRIICSGGLLHDIVKRRWNDHDSKNPGQDELDAAPSPKTGNQYLSWVRLLRCETGFRRISCVSSYFVFAPPIPPPVGEMVVAVVMMGEPSYPVGSDDPDPTQKSK